MIAVGAHPRWRLRRGPPGSGRGGGHMAVPSAKGTVAETPAPVPVSVGDCRLRERGIEKGCGRAGLFDNRAASPTDPPRQRRCARSGPSECTLSVHCSRVPPPPPFPIALLMCHDAHRLLPIHKEAPIICSSCLGLVPFQGTPARCSSSRCTAWPACGHGRWILRTEAARASPSQRPLESDNQTGLADRDLVVLVLRPRDANARSPRQRRYSKPDGNGHSVDIAHPSPSGRTARQVATHTL